MPLFQRFLRLTANQRMALLALVVFSLDQVTKLAVLQWLGFQQERIILEGFFKFVHWGNTGAAWSMFRGQNNLLAGVSAIAMFALWRYRHHFEADHLVGQISLGLLFGGILGNLLDRLLPSRRHVIDFIYFHLQPRDGPEIGFPAFNVADSAICIGVGLMMMLSWMRHPRTPAHSALPSGVVPGPAESPKP
jgi:signal peptidase II